MCYELEKRRFRIRVRKAFRHPWRPLLKRCGLLEADAQSDFIIDERWPAQVRKELERVPQGFISEYSLHSEAAYWLYSQVLRQAPKAVLELGSGISTVLIALAMRELDLRNAFISLESERFWSEKTIGVLKRLDLDFWAKVHDAPLKPFAFRGQQFQVHDFSGFDGFKAEFFFVDAPPWHIGREGAVPRFHDQLAPGARIVLDDAARVGELKAVELWTDSGVAEFDGFLPIGRGYAVLTAKRLKSAEAIKSG